MSIDFYRWASLTGHMGIALVPDCEADGYAIIGADPRYPDSVLMKQNAPVSLRNASDAARREFIEQALRTDHTMSYIAQQLGISRQRADQIIRRRPILFEAYRLSRTRRRALAQQHYWNQWMRTDIGQLTVLTQHILQTRGHDCAVSHPQQSQCRWARPRLVITPNMRVRISRPRSPWRLPGSHIEYFRTSITDVSACYACWLPNGFCYVYFPPHKAKDCYLMRKDGQPLRARSGGTNSRPCPIYVIAPDPESVLMRKPATTEDAHEHQVRQQSDFPRNRHSQG